MRFDRHPHPGAASARSQMEYFARQEAETRSLVSSASSKYSRLKVFCFPTLPYTLLCVVIVRSRKTISRFRRLNQGCCQKEPKAINFEHSKSDTNYFCSHYSNLQIIRLIHGFRCRCLHRRLHHQLLYRPTAGTAVSQSPPYPIQPTPA